jgi:hypothetical protein
MKTPYPQSPGPSPSLVGPEETPQKPERDPDVSEPAGEGDI